MPELPEVETIIRGLRPDLVGKRVQSVDLRWARTLATPSPVEFKKRLRGQRIEAVTRRAKYIHLHLSKGHLLIHLRMSGDLLLKERTQAPEKHDRLILTLSNGSSLAFNDARKFGRVWLTDNPDEVLARLGPEPLDAAFTSQVFYERLQAHRRQLKPLLLDQSFLAGLGNIYTDEALHMAGLHPRTKSDLISREQVEDLWRAVRNVLQEGIRRNGASIDWVYRGGEFQNHFRVYDRGGEPCPACGTAIQRILVGQRGTHICPTCQPKVGD